ncbi:Rha family transcriptional regulator [uncultured Clostridium sp.]|uniref:Rha family transcriptional regulator n=1 Tax=uncultured Clostridium sp. TaxID=59620 RepID=UPI0025D2DCD7|nr:Rha family transcriptional regulator [uncultured Clostridium sp.]
MKTITNPNQLNLVELVQSKQEYFTTSEIIANNLNREHRSILQVINNNIEFLNNVDNKPVAFEMREGITSEGNTYQKRIAILNEPQAMLLITFLEDNKKSGTKVRDFKVALIQQFQLMKKYLIGRADTRNVGKLVHRKMTDTVQIMNELHPEVTDFINHSYSLYSNLVYKKLYGKTASQLKEEYDLKKTRLNYRDVCSLEELQKIERLEDQIQIYIYKNKLYKLPPNEAYQEVKKFLEIA